MTLRQLLVVMFLPVLASGVANAVQCKVQGETEIARCILGGLLAGLVSVAFFFIGWMIGGGT